MQPTDISQIKATVACVFQQNGSTKLSGYGGGHGYAAYGLGGADGFVVIDSSEMKSISVDVESKTANVGMGALVGELATAIGEKGFALPHGTCSSIGVIGHALGGGWGFSSRPWGWMTDHLTSILYVNATGGINVAGESSTGTDLDVWFGLRGAGANNFGQVVEMNFALVEAPANSINWRNVLQNNDECAQALLTMQDLGSREVANGGLPAELGVQLLMYGENTGNPGACSLAGQFMGSMEDYRAAEQTILSNLAGRNVALQPGNATEFTNWVETLTNLMGNLSAPPNKVPYYAQSLMDDGSPGYTLESALAITAAVQATVGVQGSGTSLSFDLNGPVSATNAEQPHGDSVLAAAGKRNALFLSQIYVNTFPALNDTTATSEVYSRVDAVRAAVKAAKPNGKWGAYVNYVDPRLQNWGEEYYGDALGRLKATKAEVDEFTIFDYPQGLHHA